MPVLAALAGCSETAASGLHLALVAVGLGGLAAALAYALGRQQPRRDGVDRVPPASVQPLALLQAAPTPSAAPLPAVAPTPPVDPATPAARQALAEALPGPALLLQARDPDGWVLRHLNAVAQRRWPALAAEQTGSNPLGWPEGLEDRLAAPSDPATGTPWQCLPLAAGWRLAWLDVESRPTAADVASDSDNFSFTLSHDLRAPLRVVEGFTRIVKEDYGAQLDRVGNDHLDRVLGAAARMNLMIDALLKLARLSQQPLSRQPVNISQLAGYVVDDLRRSAPERLVEIEIEPGLTVTGDPTLLRLVLENLLGNAWKYTARALTPHIELRRDAAVALPTMGFVVRDNGAGFDMRSADRLFGLFQRLHSASEFPGHGVGLASVRRIVERHGGRVWAESEPGRGASFHVELAA